jgi:capsid protein
LDPLKEAQANEIEVRMKTRSRGEVIRNRGGNPETVFGECETEEERFGPIAKSVAPDAAGQDRQVPPTDEDENPSQQEPD